MKYLCIDTTNILHRCFFAYKDQDSDTIAGMAIHIALTTINKYFKQFSPHKLVLAYDRHSWRKDYTASDLCVSKRPYKGNRRKRMTESQQVKYQQFISHLGEFENLMISHSSAINLVSESLEADDLIAGFVQHNMNDDNEFVIISADGDYIQLLKHPNVKLITPIKDKVQTLTDYNNSADYFIFLKCIRGEMGESSDNVQSAYPGVREAKLKKAFGDSFEYTSLMNTKWTLPDDGREMTVGVLFKENELLMNLEKQPKYIRTLITDTIVTEMSSSKTFSMFHFLKFLGKHKLVKIKDSLDQYIPMLSR